MAFKLERCKHVGRLKMYGASIQALRRFLTPSRTNGTAALSLAMIRAPTMTVIFSPQLLPISTASNGIPRNATASTSSLPPLHQESTPIDLDTLFLPDPPISTATNGTPSPTSREESTSMDVDAPSHPAFNVIASTSTLPPPDKESTSPTPSYRNHCPHLTPSDEDRHHCVTQDDGPFGHRRNPDGDNPERYGSHRHRSQGINRPCRSSQDDSPGHLCHHTRDPRDDSPRRYHPGDSHQDGGGRSLPRRPHSREPHQHNPNVMAHPLGMTVTFEIQTDTVEDYVYYHFGFHLDENPYTAVPSSAFNVKFSDWLQVLRSIGCHQLDSSLMHCQPIQEFLQCLLSTHDPLYDVPAKFWDLNPSNSASLNLVNLAAEFVRIEPKMFPDGTTRYLIRPVNLNASRDSPWVLAVDAMTALKCVRRHLGPHTTDIANFLLTRGIPFSTLQRMPSIPGLRTPPRPMSTLLGTQPMDHKFGLADFLAYQSLCESVVKSKPFGHAALCMGGIVARLAREIIPNTATLLGPSQAALEGSQKIMSFGDEFFCYNKLPAASTNLICGVYKIPMRSGSAYTLKST